MSFTPYMNRFMVEMYDRRFRGLGLGCRVQGNLLSLTVSSQLHMMTKAQKKPDSWKIRIALPEITEEGEH